MPLYVKGKNQTLGDTSDNFATSAAQIYEQRQGAVSDGFYWIKASGMANAAQLWCDFSCGGGTIGLGFQRFWWWGTKGVNGNETSDTWPSGGMFSVADISTITHSQHYGWGRIPSGVTPTYLLIKGDNVGNKNNIKPVRNKMPHLIYKFDTSNNTAMAAKASMQSGTTYDQAGSVWPVWQNGTHVSWSYFGSQDYWYYTNKSGVLSFNLDDDSGYYYTAFSGGYDNGPSVGTDFVSDQHTNSKDNTLELYWK
tara:strand:- start:61 stop:816 length:756 start_codon:yes stop_codon:yes gene_type:complete